MSGRTPQKIDRERGKRLRQALGARGPHKMMALAADLNLSPAAVSKWMQGHAMSIDNACRLSDLLDVSLDTLLKGEENDSFAQQPGLTTNEQQLLRSLRNRQPHITRLIIAFVAEIPSSGSEA